MAPVNLYGISPNSKEKMKLRKPVVEKMRRDRINNSIEQLKHLLESEFKAGQPSSKLEKADILEMAVCYLRDHLHRVSSFKAITPKQGYAEGFSKCLEETLRFLAVHDPLNKSQFKLLRHFHKADRQLCGRDGAGAAAGPSYPPASGGSKRAAPRSAERLWRPW
ncbi:transcription factor HES-5-like [Lepisosteus oculatus]|uniref:transcription factor HES-5-like n=1 Tax=Lepisosteus oculatus TaxID=7918 RepID=UPI003724971A